MAIHSPAIMAQQESAAMRHFRTREVTSLDGTWQIIFDPWFEQDRVFIETVRTGDTGGTLLNDYHDGLFSLAPVLAGWESSRRNGECIDVQEFMEYE